MQNLTADDAIGKPKQTMLPLLIALFLISYGLLTLLVVEQGRTIDNQRSLIRQLFTDSSELSAMKHNAVQKHNAEAQAQAQAKAHSQANTAKSDHNTGKLRRPAPPKPPRDTSDTADERRALVSI